MSCVESCVAGINQRTTKLSLFANDCHRTQDLPRVEPASKAKSGPRDVFAYVIHEGKIRAPVGAMALIARLNA